MKKACVIGWPIAHSRSPLIHGYWLQKHGIAGQYEKQAIEASELRKFLNAVKAGAWQGCNVTLPHKQAVISLIDVRDDRVSRIGSANTLYLDQGKLCATSTDGPGFLANLVYQCPDFEIAGSTIVVLGAGGSARAIVDELVRNDAAQVIVANRTHEKAQQLAIHFGPRVIAVEVANLHQHVSRCNLLVNATAAGMAGSAALSFPFDALGQETVVYDIVYTPLLTPFLQAALRRELRIVTGLGMLLHQAVTGFEKWFGVRPVVTQELHDLVARDIDPLYKSLQIQ